MCIFQRNRNIQLILFSRCGESDNDDIVRIAHEEFTAILCSLFLISHFANSIVQTKLSAIVCNNAVPRKVDIQIPEILISSPLRRTSCPECFFIELYLFSFDTSEKHTSQFAITYWQCRSHPVCSGMIVPQLHRWLFRMKAAGEKKAC